MKKQNFKIILTKIKLLVKIFYLTIKIKQDYYKINVKRIKNANLSIKSFVV